MRKRIPIGNGVALLALKSWQYCFALAMAVLVVMWMIPSPQHIVVMLHLTELQSNFAPGGTTPFLLASVFSFLRKNPASNSAYDNSNNASSGLPIDTMEWSIELLRALEWKRLEMLCAEYFRVLGKRVETDQFDQDERVNVRIYTERFRSPEYVVMSRVSGKLVETKPVRELLEIAENEIAGKGMFITSGSFSEDARKYGLEHQRKMFLIDGEKFLYMLKKLPEDKQQLLLNIATEGDFTSPTCPSCGAKMVWRKVGKLWGCEHSPRCKATIKVEK